MAQTKTILSLFPGLMSGRRLADEGELQQLVQLLFSTQSGIVGTTLAPGTPLTAAINEVVGGTAVLLPPALAGRQIIVVNAITATSDVLAYPQPVNSLNNNLPDTVNSNDVPFGTTSLFICYVTGAWMNLTLTQAPIP